MALKCPNCGFLVDTAAGGRCPNCLHIIPIWPPPEPFLPETPVQPRNRKRILRVGVILVGATIVVVLAVAGIKVLLPTPKIAPDLESLSAGVCRIESGNARGSGFIIDKRGLILTASHVIGASSPRISELKILMNDNGVYQGDDIGLMYNNPERDLALLLVKPSTISGYPCFLLGRVLKPNEDIIALGYPFGRFNTASGKTTLSDETVIKGHSFLTMDAILDEGYSGGPIVDDRGKAIGVTTARRGRGQSFAVPIGFARALIGDVLNEKIVARLCDLNKDDFRRAKNYGMSILYNFENMDQLDLLSDFDMIPSDGWKLRGTYWDGSSLYRQNRLYFYRVGEYPNAIDVSAPNQEGLILTKQSYDNFVLEASFFYRHRLDGWRNIDFGVVFRYIDAQHYYRFSTFSGIKIDQERATFEQDAGGLWKIDDESDKCVNISIMLSPFEAYRLYTLKVVATGNEFSVYVDNMKVLEWTDYALAYFGSGQVGFRVISGLADIYSLRISEL
ncbi:MAG: trypsin-like peptidase domain-containing protein [candidate division Zixibacteria bacterium]|nr:trypsin-like peptidase domain-containing protein [candidate division Zixibacteria bacterium]